MRKIISLAVLVTAMWSFSSCSEKEATAQDVGQPVAVQVQKTPEMIAFEDSFKGITARMAKGKNAKNDEMSKIVSISRAYLEDHGAIYDKRAKDMDIIRQALNFHGQELKKLQTKN